MPRDLKIKTTFQSVDKSTRVIGKIQSKMMRFTASTAMGLRKIDRTMSKVRRGMSHGLKIGIVSASGAAIGLYAAINKTAESMDKLAKKSRAINFPIEEFQEFRFVAEQSGVSSDVFDKSLTKFTKTVGELKGGYGALYTALRKTNRPLLRQLKSTDDVSKAFEIYLNAIAKTPGAMDKAALSTAAFGRSGIDMINMANAGSKEIEKLRKQMRENGVVTAEQAAKAEAYNDMMNRVRKTGMSLMVDVFSPMMPVLTNLADGARKWAVANKGLISSKLKSYLDWTVNNFDKIVSTLKKIGTGIAIFYGLSAAIKVASVSMQVFNALSKIDLSKVRKLGSYFGKTLPTEIGKSSSAMKLFGKGIGLVAAAFVTYEIGKLIYDNFAAPMIRANKELDRLKGKIEETKKKGLSNLNAPQLQTEKNRAEKALNLEKDLGKKTGWLMATSTGMGAGFGVLQYDKAQTARENELKKYGAQVKSAIVRRRDIDIARSPMSDEWSTSTQMVKEQVEITIKDETGRAHITKGRRGRGLKLAHTGSMP
jgi:hypothetical protein